MEFKEMTKRDAVFRLSAELIKLRKTSGLSAEKNEIIDKEFDGFERLFGKYLRPMLLHPLFGKKLKNYLRAR